MYMTCESWTREKVICVKTLAGSGWYPSWDAGLEDDFIWEEPYKGKATRQNHKSVVTRRIKDYYDPYMPREATKIKVVGQEVGIGHYMWIVVITRRTTRTRA